MCIGDDVMWGGQLSQFPVFSPPFFFPKASVVGASYKRRYTSNSHANAEGDLEKRGRKGKCAIESQWREGGKGVRRWGRLH